MVRKGRAVKRKTRMGDKQASAGVLLKANCTNGGGRGSGGGRQMEVGGEVVGEREREGGREGRRDSSDERGMNVHCLDVDKDAHT